MMHSTAANASMNATAYAVSCWKFWYFCSTNSVAVCVSPADVAGDHLDGAELAQRAGEAEDDAVHDRPLDAGQGDPAEGLPGVGPEAACGLLLVVAHLLQHRHDLADDQRQRHEDRRHDHAGRGEDHLEAGVSSHGPNQP